MLANSNLLPPAACNGLSVRDVSAVTAVPTSPVLSVRMVVNVPPDFRAIASCALFCGLCIYIFAHAIGAEVRRRRAIHFIFMPAIYTRNEHDDQDNFDQSFNAY
jgi:hypothetical protein